MNTTKKIKMLAILLFLLFSALPACAADEAEENEVDMAYLEGEYSGFELIEEVFKGLPSMIVAMGKWSTLFAVIIGICVVTVKLAFDKARGHSAGVAEHKASAFSIIGLFVAAIVAVKLVFFLFSVW